MRYETERLILRTLLEEEAPLLHNYLKRNREFLEKWEPKRQEDFYSIENLENIIKQENESNLSKMGISLYMFKNDDKQNIIGNVKLNNIVYGVFLSCFLGYKLDFKEVNKGYTTEAVEKLIRIAFEEYGLHRIEGNIIPRNKASIKVVEKLGFVCEGVSPKYLKINGVWEDHLHYVILNKALE